MPGGQRAAIDRVGPRTAPSNAWPLTARLLEIITQHRSAAWFLLGAAAAATFTAVIGLQLTRQPATAAEAQLAAATSATHLGGPVPAGWPQSLAARQLAAVELLVDPSQTAALIDATRAAALIFAVAASLAPSW